MQIMIIMNTKKTGVAAAVYHNYREKEAQSTSLQKYNMENSKITYG